MYSFRKWLYRPKKSDSSLLAQFYYSDEELNLIAAELDSFDGRKDPERCAALVNHLRLCQDKVLGIIQKIMDQAITLERASRHFRVKFPDDVLQESLAGQLWFGAECLAAGSSIMNREVESASMRPLARALTKNLDSLRSILREQCLRNINAYTDRIKEALVIFDKLFAEFELSYVSAMVPVKTMKEYDMLQEVIVLFSETVQRALKLHLITQDAIDDYDPSLMFTIPRLAIICGLLVYPEGPLNPDNDPSNVSEMFRPFQSLLFKIRELLYTLDKDELFMLEKSLCSLEEPSETSCNGREANSIEEFSPVEITSDCGRLMGISVIGDYQDTLGGPIIIHTPNSGSPVTPLCEERQFELGCISQSPSVATIVAEQNNVCDIDPDVMLVHCDESSMKHQDSSDSGLQSENVSLSDSVQSMPQATCSSTEQRNPSDIQSGEHMSCSSKHGDDKLCGANRVDAEKTCSGALLLTDIDEMTDSQLTAVCQCVTCNNSSSSSSTCSSMSTVTSERVIANNIDDDSITSSTYTAAICDIHNDLTDLEASDSMCSNLPNVCQAQRHDCSNVPRISIKCPSVDNSYSDNSGALNSIDVPCGEIIGSIHVYDDGISELTSVVSHSSDQQMNGTSDGQRDSGLIVDHSYFSEDANQDSNSYKETLAKDLIDRPVSPLQTNDKYESCNNHIDTTKISNKVNSAISSSTPSSSPALQRRFISDSSGICVETEDMNSVGLLDVPRFHDRRGGDSTVSTCSSISSAPPGASDADWDRESCASSETSSYNSECHDDEEIALAIHAAEMACRHEARSRFRSSSDLTHRLFVCISGVADQLQTNYASDLRNILKSVFEMNCMEPLALYDRIENRSALQPPHQPGMEIMDENFPQANIDGDIPEADLINVVNDEDDDDEDDELSIQRNPRSRMAHDPPIWVPDEEAASCVSCKVPFTLVRRRHHCRNCGKIFCSRCSANSVPLPHFGHSKPVRVCTRCFMFQVTPFTMTE